MESTHEKVSAEKKEKKSAHTFENLITLQSLAELTGFPQEFIISELFSPGHKAPDNFTLEELREVMVNYLNKTMIV